MKKTNHDRCLELLINTPSIIGEDRKKMSFILKEPIWMHKNSNDMQKMCDLVYGYQNQGIPVEVKGTDKYREKALIQLQQGAIFIQNELGLYVPYGKIVYYAMDEKLVQDIITKPFSL